MDDVSDEDARPRIKVHGIFRSGTNLAKHLLTERYAVDVSFHGGGHKHLPLPCLPGVTEHDTMPVVVCVKNPLANLVSLFEYAVRVRFRHFDCGRTWAAFLSQPLRIRMNGDPRWPLYRFAHPVDYWNAFYANALSLPASRSFLINYEALLRDPAAVLARLDAVLPPLPARHGATGLPERVLSRGGDATPDAPFAEAFFDKRDWYLDRRWLARYDARQLRWVADRIDPQVLSDAGYAPADVRRSACTGRDAGSTRA